MLFVDPRPDRRIRLNTQARRIPLENPATLLKSSVRNQPETRPRFPGPGVIAIN
jgi:hypothetical protein